MRNFTITLLLFAAAFSAQAQPKQIQTKPFENLWVYGPFRVTLVAAEKEKIEIEYRGIDADEVAINSYDGTLELKVRNKHFWSRWNDNDSNPNVYCKVTVYYKKLREINIQAGATIQSNELISAPFLRLVSRMGAEMRLDVKTTELDLESSMGSEVELTGTTESLEVNSKMGSTVKAIRLKSERVRVSAHMGSTVTVFASREIDASAGFGASINFAGDPTVRNTSSSFGGEASPTHRLN